MKKILQISFLLCVLATILFSSCNVSAKKENKYTVTFDTRGGEAVGVQNVISGECAVAPYTSRGNQ